MENCKQVLQALTEYLEGDLPSGDEQEFEHHMEDCRPCDAFFRTYKKSSELARDTLRVEDIPEELQNRVRRFLKTKLGLEQ